MSPRGLALTKPWEERAAHLAQKWASEFSFDAAILERAILARPQTEVDFGTLAGLDVVPELRKKMFKRLWVTMHPKKKTVTLPAALANVEAESKELAVLLGRYRKYDVDIERLEEEKQILIRERDALKPVIDAFELLRRRMNEARDSVRRVIPDGDGGL